MKTKSTARYLAWQALDRVAQGERVEEALNRVVEGLDPDPRERGLVWELTYGVCRWRGFLDHHLQAFSKKPLTKLSPEVLTLLRLGAYQLLKLDRVPDRAAVHATVEVASQNLPKWKTGFVNGVLRALGRNKDRLAPPDQAKDLAGHLAVVNSHPRWLVARWLKELGPEVAEARLKADNRRAGLCLRVNPLTLGREYLVARMDEAGLESADNEVMPGRFSPWALYVPGGSMAVLEGILGTDSPALFQAQSEAAQAVAPLIAPRPGMRVLDLCAGVGGKTLHLAELSRGQAEIVALERSGHRVRAGERAVERAGHGSIRYIKGDALKVGLADLGGEPFDAVLIDAPCTGSGVLAERPDIRWRLKQGDPARMARTQEKLLVAGAGLVGPGGVLVYATCSLFPEENQGVVRAFLDAHPLFSREDPSPLLPESLKGLVGKEGFLVSDPGEHGLDGFFGVRMIKSL